MLGLSMLDEPCLKPSDPTAIEMEYLHNRPNPGASLVKQTLVSTV